ncbi:hypothetical protein BC827DRAFT_859878 [Russula dissimulans]|nr:hypothetical protein BC827DRAFT_859878 [Russula dissimulans]
MMANPTKNWYGLWVMGYGLKIPANQLGKWKIVWVITEYGLSQIETTHKELITTSLRGWTPNRAHLKNIKQPHEFYSYRTALKTPKRNPTGFNKNTALIQTRARAPLWPFRGGRACFVAQCVA